MKVFIRIAVAGLFCLCAHAQQPGAQGEDYLLPNGWKISPVGRSIPTPDTVLNIAVSPDGKVAAALSCGFNDHVVTIVDLATGEKQQAFKLPGAWLGLAWAPDGQRLYVSGGNRPDKGDDPAPIFAIPFVDGRLTRHHMQQFRDTLPREQTFWTGIALHPTQPVLYACSRLSGEVVAFNTETGEVAGRVKVERDPYDVAVSADGATLYCSNWGSDSLSVVDTASMTLKMTVHAGDNPNDIALLPDGRLAVCSANDNSVRFFDTAEMKFTERVLTSLYPGAPEGSTPNALAYDPADHLLYVANGDNYNIAVISTEEAGEARVNGFIPAGWYPSALALSQDGEQLLIGNAKGTESYATPLGPKRPNEDADPRRETIKTLMRGNVNVVDLESGDLAQWTQKCISNCPYNDALLAQAKAPAQPSVVPQGVGAGSPIKHVLYIIKENRTYDQVFGDITGANGDPSLCLFGENVTPNQHKLAREFVLFDNLYCDAEVSMDGHMWSNAAYATDFTEKNWPADYGNKIASGESIAELPASGFIWDKAVEKGLSYRSYGEFAMRQSDGSSMAPAHEMVRALHGHIAPAYQGWGVRDTENAAEFIKEFDAYEKNYDSADPTLRLPNFMVMALPEDHTHGTKAGHPTPVAAVASNDLALGQIVERISHSRYWPETAIFVIQDDAQDGSDHVDARRTIGQCISPYTRRGTVDSTLYSTSSMIRTMELLLGLQPMSQYDAAATPMYNALDNVADLTPFDHVEAQVDLNEMNPENAPGAKVSMRMDFSAPDLAPMFALNEVVWKSVRGEDSAMPLPVHRFHAADPLVHLARYSPEEDEDDEH